MAALGFFLGGGGVIGSIRNINNIKSKTKENLNITTSQKKKKKKKKESTQIHEVI